MSKKHDYVLEQERLPEGSNTCCEGGNFGDLHDCRKQQGQLVPTSAQVPAVQPTLIDVFSALARDQTIPVERIKQLIDLQQQVEAKQAEREFTAAFARLKFPPIQKKSKAHNSKYAAWEDIQDIITPILAAEGFTLAFSSGEITDKGIPIHATLAHIAGHSQPGMLVLPRDKSGSMNELQGVGSTTSYGCRYLAKMMLNLRFIGDDDNGNASSAITEEQRMNIETLMKDCRLTEDGKSKYFEFIGVKVLSDLQQGGYRAAINFLVAKRKAVEEKTR